MEKPFCSFGRGGSVAPLLAHSSKAITKLMRFYCYALALSGSALLGSAAAVADFGTAADLPLDAEVWRNHFRVP